MRAFRVTTQVQSDGSLLVRHPLLKAGEEVEVIVLMPEFTPRSVVPYPLRNMVLEYLHPMDPVAEWAWNIEL